MLALFSLRSSCGRVYRRAATGVKDKLSSDTRQVPLVLRLDGVTRGLEAAGRRGGVGGGAQGWGVWAGRGGGKGGTEGVKERVG